MKRRTISPAIASIVLIGVAITGSVAAGSAMLKQNEIASIITKVDLIDATLVNMNVANKAYFATAIKNSGTTSLNFVSVGFLDDDGNSQSMSSNEGLNPGQQWSSYLVTGVSVIHGKKYVLHVDATTKSGSQFHWADTVTARG
ncbi:hypothetical protein QVH35_07110 [Candidatus Nitrosotenuis chungbukensis]|uniref:hypothetical protein n=1 Tax=Candidatus Nitrosotenuis chungbukensis TaxID=1353246 RepID=UPI002671CC9E|nr:hypothetical protein [Candidatus Nitrosotenuis chungbukensis]WKT57203.1 hypothetical protein QVH35_07110 [Candidatus Nitrosotenuis chungbukensis]